MEYLESVEKEWKRYREKRSLKMGISSDVILFLYKHCLVSRNDLQIMNLLYRTVKERVNIRGGKVNFSFFSQETERISLNLSLIHI